MTIRMLVASVMHLMSPSVLKEIQMVSVVFSELVSPKIICRFKVL